MGFEKLFKNQIQKNKTTENTSEKLDGLIALSQQIMEVNNQEITLLFKDVMDCANYYMSSIIRINSIHRYDDGENYFSNNNYLNSMKQAEIERETAHNNLMLSIDSFKRKAKKAHIDTSIIPDIKRRVFVTNWALALPDKKLTEIREILESSLKM